MNGAYAGEQETKGNIRVFTNENSIHTNCTSEFQCEGDDFLFRIHV